MGESNRLDERLDIGLYGETPVGVAMALATTPTGGETRDIVTRVVEEGEGIGCLKLEGEADVTACTSARTARNFAQEILRKKQPDNTFFANSVFVLGLPGGRGTSAGCTMATSMLSLAMKKPVRYNLAMTGTINLTGKILGIGGVKEKTMAARESQVKTLIFPEANRGDFDELAENLKEGIDVRFVDQYEKIFEIAFGYDEENPVEIGFARCLPRKPIDGLGWYIKATIDAIDEGKGSLDIESRLGEEMKDIVFYACDLAVEILLEKQPENTFFADSVLRIYLPDCSIIYGTCVGCAIITSFLSLSMNKPLRKDLAITGTVTQTGNEILGIGSVKEMIISAKRSHVKMIIFPEANRGDFDELEEYLREGIDVHFVDKYEQIYEIVFGSDH